MKRLLDLVVASILLALTSPLFVLAAALVRTSGKGPVIYRGSRVGKDGKGFTILKFRTMISTEGPAVTRAGDDRVTKSGRWLRKWKLDELPQLFNVLKGDMSLVGPRPEDPRYVALYTEDQRRVLRVRPGLVGPTALHFRNEEALLARFADPEVGYVKEVMPRKLEMDLEYVDGRSIGGDLRILGKTVRALFNRDDPGF
jgi:lipopolysaccharide/colanic/teichoic acid biosynthesis glycosyltransferase